MKMKRHGLSLLVAGSIGLASCHSQRLAVVPMSLPRLSAATPPDSAVAAPGRPSPRRVAAQAIPGKVTRHRPRTVAARRPVFRVRPVVAERVSKRPRASLPATHHDPRPEHFLPMATMLTIAATLLLGLLVAGIIFAPLPLAILLGLFALVVLAIDVFAISYLLDGLEDQRLHRLKRQ
jgi:hypothetical protein